MIYPENYFLSRKKNHLKDEYILHYTVTLIATIFSQVLERINLVKFSIRYLSVDESIDLGSSWEIRYCRRHSSNERNAKCNLNPGVVKREKKGEKSRKVNQARIATRLERLKKKSRGFNLSQVYDRSARKAPKQARRVALRRDPSPRTSIERKWDFYSTR